MKKSEHFGLLRGVLAEHVDDYRAQVRHLGLAEARQQLLPTVEKIVTDQPSIATRLLTAALDKLAEEAREVNAE